MTTTVSPTRSSARPPTGAHTTADAPIPFTRLVGVEWTKATDTRAARWLLALTALGTAAIMLLPLLRPHDIDQDYRTYLYYAAMGVTFLLPVVSIMTMTSEWTQRTVLTTFVQEPRRSRVIAAKVAVSLLLGVLALAFAAVVCAAALGIAAASGRHLDANLGVASVIGSIVFVMLNLLMGVAFGALLHKTAPSIVLFYVLPTVLGILGAAVHAVGHWLDPSTTFGWVQRGEWSGHGAQIITSAALWVIVPLVLGLLRTARREIK